MRRMGVLLVLAIASAGGIRNVADGCAYCSVFADVEMTTSVRLLQVAYLTFAHRWPRMSGLTVSECVLPTLS